MAATLVTSALAWLPAFLVLQFKKKVLVADLDCWSSVVIANLLCTEQFLLLLLQTSAWQAGNLSRQAAEYSLLQMLGVHPVDGQLVTALLWPLVLTAVLFAGPLLHKILVAWEGRTQRKQLSFTGSLHSLRD